jgi:hypothetical protein
MDNVISSRLAVGVFSHHYVSWCIKDKRTSAEAVVLLL